MYPHRYFLLFISWLSFLSALAQPVPPLERIISVDIRSERLGNILNAISREGRFNFSYSPTVVNENSTVTLRVSNAPVREALNQLFRGTVTYKSRGNHVILLRAELPDEADIPKNFYLDGYIIDSETGQKLTQASIYEKTTLASAISNPYGYYRIKLPTALPALRLEVRKQNYFGETVTISSRQSHSLNIRLAPAPVGSELRPLPIRKSTDTSRIQPAITVQPVQPVLVASADTTKPSTRINWERQKEEFKEWVLTTKQEIHDANLAGDTLHRDVQVSLLPFIGTNGKLSARVINRLSFNILAGYSLGVTGLELGGVLNGVRGNVSGIQISGFGNVVGDEVTGLQLAGAANVVLGDVKGIQLAGNTNFVRGNMDGLQLAGLTNITLGSMDRSLQAAGLLNMTLGDMTGLQAAGYLNIAGQQFRGVQVAGVGNVVSRDATGLQVSGALNVAARQLDGWQISGFINSAKRITRGHQIGLFNFAGYSEKMPIGLFSWVQQNGYRRLEFTTDEVNLANITFKTGHRAFYNIFTMGSPLNRVGVNRIDRPAWSFGYGLGTAVNLRRGWMMNVDAVGNYLLPDNWSYFDEGSSLLRINMGIEKKLTPHLALAIGPSVNWFMSGNEARTPATRANIPLVSYRYNTDGFASSAWVGFHAGIRFCSR
ncbi:hypothetical protein GCM10023189_20770 [Nibrella saemangeumensis]|uniref:Secretin/TonB short N-terminal domain-containing protein n=1 Tax=Nibrella saemangeumensis TaxID=1084526 RepID=A0ABP8MQH2_9BACT